MNLSKTIADLEEEKGKIDKAIGALKDVMLFTPIREIEKPSIKSFITAPALKARHYHKKYRLTCNYCKKTFLSPRSNAKFCSDSHRGSFHTENRHRVEKGMEKRALVASPRKLVRPASLVRYNLYCQNPDCKLNKSKPELVFKAKKPWTRFCPDCNTKAMKTRYPSGLGNRKLATALKPPVQTLATSKPAILVPGDPLRAGIR